MKVKFGLVVATIVYAVCLVGVVQTAHATEEQINIPLQPVTINPDGTVPQPAVFADQGVPKVQMIGYKTTCNTSRADSNCAGSTSTSSSTCYGFNRAWGVYNHANQLMYAWRLYLEWCTSGGKIYSLNHGSGSDDNGGYCARYGGFYEYRGCDGARGSLNQPTLRTFDDWTFRQYAWSTYAYAYPATDITVTSTGGVSGTVYFS